MKERMTNPLRKILIFAGTTEGRALSEVLCENHIRHFISVATDYGVQVLTENPYAKVLQGRMNEAEIADFVWENQIDLVVDATHPYAKVVTENIKKALQNTRVELWRLARELQQVEGEQIFYFKDSESCAKALQKSSGNIFLTTGSKELSVFAREEEVKKRLVVRVLPGMESIGLCEAAGVCGKQIVAMQGPFSLEMNVALMRQFDIGCLVTKQSGKNGGFMEKIEAAKQLGIPVYVIGALEETQGISLGEVCRRLELSFSMDIKLVGCGMGQEKSLTREAYAAICEADILLGASRLIAPYSPAIEKKTYYLATDILPYLMQWKKQQTRNLSVVILFSGDSGFYSGSKKMVQALYEAIESGELKAKVEVLPGISSISYLASTLQESWEDAKIVSVHGKGETSQWMDGLMETIVREEKTFVLLSGDADVKALGEELFLQNRKDCELWVGYQLSYLNERVFRYEFLQESGCDAVQGVYDSRGDFVRRDVVYRGEDLPRGLYCCFIKNKAFGGNLCISDEKGESKK